MHKALPAKLLLALSLPLSAAAQFHDTRDTHHLQALKDEAAGKLVAVSNALT
jgi:hypothetical protein